MFRKSSGLTKVIICIADCMVIIVSMIIAILLRFSGLKNINSDASLEEHILFTAIFVGVYLIYTIFDTGKYNFYKRGLLLEFLLVILSNLFSGVVTIFVLYLIHIANQYSRIVVGIFLIINIVMMYLLHTFIKILLPKLYMKVDSKINLIIIGPAEYVGSMSAELDNDAIKYQICAYATIDGNDFVGDKNIIKVRTDNIEDYCLRNSIDEIMVCLDSEHTDEWIPILDRIAGSGVVIKYQINKPQITNSSYQGMETVGKNSYLVFANNSASTGELFVKRTIDIIFGLIGTLITVVLTIFIGIAIKIESKGPIFFKQKRVGKNGRVFEILKFRSMVQDAEEKKAQLGKDNQMEGAIFKIDSDPRITKVGKFIRKTSLDEFPQFINVLKGEMSVVGVRPPTLDEYAQYSLNQKNRLSFRPGITGLWQISGRNDIKNFDDIVMLDMKYINEWSLYTDLKIMLMTIPAMFKGR